MKSKAAIQPILLSHNQTGSHEEICFTHREEAGQS